MTFSFRNAASSGTLAVESEEPPVAPIPHTGCGPSLEESGAQSTWKRAMDGHANCPDGPIDQAVAYAIA